MPARFELLDVAVMTGDMYQVVLTLRKTFGDSEFDFLTITMWDVQIRAISTNSATGDRGVTEQIKLNFDEAMFAYTPHDDEGSAGITKEALVTSASSCK